MSTWPTTTYNGKEYYVSDGVTLIDPTTGAAVVMLKPSGGFAIGLTPIEVGPPGRNSDIDEAINFTPLDPTDPSPGSASWTQLRPSTDTDPALYKLNLALRTGQKGDDGLVIITPSSYSDTPVAKQQLVVGSGGTAFELEYQKFLGRHYPATIANAASGDTNKTLATISVPSGTYNRDYRVEVEAQTIVTGTGPNVVVDLVAHLGDETSGNDIGRCFGIGGSKDRLLIAGGAAFGDITDGWDKIAAGSGFTVSIRTEKQSGSDNYTTSSDTTRIRVKVYAI